MKAKIYVGAKKYALYIGRKIVPDGYTQLEYIESTGTQYLSIPYIVNNNTVFYCRYNQVEAGSDIASVIFGVTNSASATSANNGILRLLSGTEIYNRMGWGDTTYGSVVNTSTSSQYNTWYEVLYDQNKMYQDGVLINTSATPNSKTWRASYNLGLFARTSSSVTMYAKAKISDVWAKEKGVLVLNLIPAKRNSDSVLGMYDTVSNTFFTNAGTGTFIGGEL